MTRYNSKEAWEYWCNPPSENSPQEYMKLIETSLKIVNLFNTYFNTDDSIMELGCNCGRNLNALYDNGFNNVFGIEINKCAIDYGYALYPNLYGRILHGALETKLPIIEDDAYDIVFTNAVLIHVAYDSDWIFKHIPRIARKYVCTSEIEKVQITPMIRNFPRDFEKIFKDLGLELIHTFPNYVNNNYITRIYKK